MKITMTELDNLIEFNSCMYHYLCDKDINLANIIYTRIKALKLTKIMKKNLVRLGQSRDLTLLEVI